MYPGISKTVAALIAFAGTILAALIKNYFERVNLKETELRKEKQKNYDELISSLGPFIRNPEKNNDIFVTIHLKSWIYGSEKITELTKELVEYNRNSDFDKLNETLETLLRKMRAEVGLEPVNEDYKMINAFIALKEIREERGT